MRGLFMCEANVKTSLKTRSENSSINAYHAKKLIVQLKTSIGNKWKVKRYRIPSLHIIVRYACMAAHAARPWFPHDLKLILVHQRYGRIR